MKNYADVDWVDPEWLRFIAALQEARENEGAPEDEVLDRLANTLLSALSDIALLRRYHSLDPGML